MKNEWLKRFAAKAARMEEEAGAVPMASRPTGTPLSAARQRELQRLAIQSGHEINARAGVRIAGVTDGGHVVVTPGDPWDDAVAQVREAFRGRLATPTRVADMMRRRGFKDCYIGLLRDSPYPESDIRRYDLREKPPVFGFGVAVDGELLGSGSDVEVLNHPREAPHLPRRWISYRFQFADGPGMVRRVREACDDRQLVRVVVGVAEGGDHVDDCRVVGFAWEADGKLRLLELSGEKWCFVFTKEKKT